MSYQGFVSLSRDKTFCLETPNSHQLQRKTSFSSRDAPVSLSDWVQVLLSVTENVCFLLSFFFFFFFIPFPLLFFNSLFFTLFFSFLFFSFLFFSFLFFFSSSLDG